jgi:ATP-dependent Clp protease ATP-binding subunit ClpA
MFQRFDDDARRVIVLAQEEARGLRHAEIGTEHLLLAVYRVLPGLLAEHTLDGLRAAVHQHRPPVDPGPGASGHIPFTANLKAAMNGSMREVGHEPHPQIRPPHLLLATLRLADCGAVAVLRSLGVRPDTLALHVSEDLAKPPEPAPGTDLAVRVELLESQVRALKDEIRELRRRLN